MRPFGKDGASGFFIYIFTLIAFFLGFWILRDIELIPDFGILYNTAFTVIITVVAYVVATVLKRNMRSQGKGMVAYNG